MNIFWFFITTKKKRLAEFQEHRNEVILTARTASGMAYQQGLHDAREDILISMIPRKPVVEQEIEAILERKGF